MLIVPLVPVPSQTLAIVLAQQNCELSLYLRGTHLYIDLSFNGNPVITTRICRNVQRLLRDAGYHGFIGDFMFLDLHVADLINGLDPEYTGLGSRFQLIYLEASDLPP